MNKTRYDELMKAFRTGPTMRGAALTEASKILEINYTMRQVDRELNMCKSAITEGLQAHEIAAMTFARLESERNKIGASSDKLTDFAVNVRQRIMEIAKTRNSLLSMINTEKNNDEEFYNEKVSKTIREINDERDNVLADIETVGRNVQSLVAELNDITESMKLEKRKNATIRSTLLRKRNDAIDRYTLRCHDTSARHKDIGQLGQSKYLNQRIDLIKVEQDETNSE